MTDNGGVGRLPGLSKSLSAGRYQTQWIDRISTRHTYMMNEGLLSVSGSTSESLELETLPYLSDWQGTTTSSSRACHG